MSSPFDKILHSKEFQEEFLVAEFQSRLAKMLDDKGMSKAELARNLGVSRARISQIFSDDAKHFSIRLVFRVFDALGEEPIVITKAEYHALQESVNRSTGDGVEFIGNEEIPNIGLPADLVADLLRANLVRTTPDSFKSSKHSDDSKLWAQAGSNVIAFREKARA